MHDCCFTQAKVKSVLLADLNAAVLKNVNNHEVTYLEATLKVVPILM